MPRTIHQAVNRIENQQRDKERSAGSSLSCLTHHCLDRDDEKDTADVHYSLGKTFGGDARRKTEMPWMKYQRSGLQRERERLFRMFLGPDWMKGVKGCFLCRKDHRSNACHKQEKVTAAINRLEEKHLQVLLSVANLAAVVHMTSLSEAESDEPDNDVPSTKTETEDEVYAQWF